MYNLRGCTTWYIANLRIYATWYIVNLRVYTPWYIVNLSIYFSFFILCSLIINCFATDLLHYDLSSVWVAIKDNIIMPIISPFWLDGKANLSHIELSSDSFELSCIPCIQSHLISLLKSHLVITKWDVLLSVGSHQVQHMHHNVNTNEEIFPN